MVSSMVSDVISIFCCFKIMQNRHRKHGLKAYAVELDLRHGCCRTWSESGPKVIEVMPRNICRKNSSQLPMSSECRERVKRVVTACLSVSVCTCVCLSAQ